MCGPTKSLLLCAALIGLTTLAVNADPVGPDRTREWHPEWDSCSPNPCVPSRLIETTS